MALGKLRGRSLKKRIEVLLRTADFSATMAEILSYPPRAVINPLFGLLLSTDSRLRWNAVAAMGEIVDRLAREDMESARVILRRLMWQLNDESGGIGWGCPEAMGEIVARNRKLAEEFAPIVISYICEDGNFLEYEPLQPGALWAVGRVAEAWPDLTRDTGKHLVPFLVSGVPEIRGNAAWALGKIGDSSARDKLAPLLKDYSEIDMYVNGKVIHVTVGQIANEAFTRLRSEGLDESTKEV